MLSKRSHLETSVTSISRGTRGEMKKKNRDFCLVCGEAKASCIRCRAEQFNKPQKFMGFSTATWLTLIVGGVAVSFLFILGIA